MVVVYEMFPPCGTYFLFLIIWWRHFIDDPSGEAGKCPAKGLHSQRPIRPADPRTRFQNGSLNWIARLPAIRSLIHKFYFKTFETVAGRNKHNDHAISATGAMHRCAITWKLCDIPHTMWRHTRVTIGYRERMHSDRNVRSYRRPITSPDKMFYMICKYLCFTCSW